MESTDRKTFGKYTILRKLGHGGMGTVYEAEHQHLHKRVALKVLHDSVAQKPGGTERFLREGRAAARLSHPNIVDVTDVGVEGSTLYLVMELLAGEDLAARVARERSLPITDAIDLLLPVCAAVSVMHEQGLVHRDLKPENIFLSRAHGAAITPKVLDFGICRDDDPREASQLSTTGGLVGTPNYMAPEQVTGRRADARSDQHALAVILYEALCAKRPYEGATLLELLASIAEGRFADPKSVRTDIPLALDRAITRALSPSPENRFESVRAFGDALLAFASDSGRLRWVEAFGASSRGDAERQSTSVSTEPSATLADPAPERWVTDVGAEKRSQTLAGSETPAPTRRTSRVSPRGLAFAASLALLSVASVWWIAARQPRAQPTPAARVVAPRSPETPAIVVTPPPPRPRVEITTAVVTLDASAQRSPTARVIRPRTQQISTQNTQTTTASPASSTTVGRPLVNGAPIVD